MLGHRSKSTVRFQESFSWTIQRFLFLFWLWTRNAREKMEYVILFLHLHSISTSFWKNTAFLLCWSADHDMVLLIASFSFFFFFGAYHKRIYSAHCDCSIHHKVFLLVIMIDIFQKKIFNQCWSIMTDWQYSFEFSSGAPLVSFFMLILSIHLPQSFYPGKTKLQGDIHWHEATPLASSVEVNAIWTGTQMSDESLHPD